MPLYRTDFAIQFRLYSGELVREWPLPCTTPGPQRDTEIAALWMQAHTFKRNFPYTSSAEAPRNGVGRDAEGMERHRRRRAEVEAELSTFTYHERRD